MDFEFFHFGKVVLEYGAVIFVVLLIKRVPFRSLFSVTKYSDMSQSIRTNFKLKTKLVESSL